MGLTFVVFLVVFAISELWIVATYYSLLRYLHLFQVATYRIREIRRILREPIYFMVRHTIPLAYIILISLGVHVILAIAGSAPLAVLVLKYELQDYYKPKKKPLVWTPRLKRLFITNLIIILSLAIFIKTLPLDVMVVAMMFYGVIPVASLIALLINQATEYPIYLYYFNKARRKVRKLSPKIIAITGSFGKTSTKHFLAHILKAKYKVLYTPGSINTPMGVAKVVNKDLEDHEIFIVEMGARYPGDIKELTKLTPPDIAIITAIGPQHLETFGSMEAILKTKLEIVEGAKEDAVVFVNASSYYLATAAEAIRPPKQVVRFGIAENLSQARNLNFYAKDIVMNRNGITFKMVFHDKEVPISIPILGRHNVVNIVCAAAVAYKLGIDIDTIVKMVKTVKPVEHRLNVTKTPTGITIIDDSFNSNVEGLREALNVLALFPGRRIVVTPGIVELGPATRAVHTEIAAAMAEVADVIILVGEKQTYYINEALKKSGFNDENLVVVKNLFEAQELLRIMVKKGDVILFENDLPDFLEV